MLLKAFYYPKSRQKCFFFSRKDLFSFIRAQYDLSYHLIKIPWLAPANGPQSLTRSKALEIKPLRATWPRKTDIIETVSDEIHVVPFLKERYHSEYLLTPDVTG